MTWLAIDTSGASAAVAVGAPGRVDATATRHGQRVHAAALLPLIDEALASAGVARSALRAVAVADGPGSFTGIRVGATVAKGLARVLGVEVWVAPALLAAAEACLREDHGVVVGVSDALRGDAYVGAWRLGEAGVRTVVTPTTLAPQDLAGLLPEPPSAVVGSVPPALVEACRAAWGGEPVAGGNAAAGLLRLASARGGLARVGDPAAWEPTYGRPAEAQARWEAEHGRPLPTAPRRS